MTLLPQLQPNGKQAYTESRNFKMKTRPLEFPRLLLVPCTTSSTFSKQKMPNNLTFEGSSLVVRKMLDFNYANKLSLQFLAVF